jgi:hypothetical protein
MEDPKKIPKTVKSARCITTCTHSGPKMVLKMLLYEVENRPNHAIGKIKPINQRIKTRRVRIRGLL